MLVGAACNWPKLHAALASDQGRALQIILSEYGRVLGDTAPRTISRDLELLQATRAWTVETLKREEMRAQLALMLWEGMRDMKTRYPYSDIVVSEVLSGLAECGPVEWMSCLLQLCWWADLSGELDWAIRVIVRWCTETRFVDQSIAQFLAKALLSLERSTIANGKERRQTTWRVRCELGALLLGLDSEAWRKLQDELQQLYYALEKENVYQARIATWVQWLRISHPDLIPILQKLVRD